MQWNWSSCQPKGSSIFLLLIICCLWEWIALSPSVCSSNFIIHVILAFLPIDYMGKNEKIGNSREFKWAVIYQQCSWTTDSLLNLSVSDDLFLLLSVIRSVPHALVMFDREIRHIWNINKPSRYTLLYCQVDRFQSRYFSDHPFLQHKTILCLSILISVLSNFTSVTAMYHTTLLHIWYILYFYQHGSVGILLYISSD